MMYDLPKTVAVGGTEYDIRSDYRAILDICVALGDPELSDTEKAYVALSIFYPELESIPAGDYEEALKQCLLFVDGGEERPQKNGPKLMDWEQDFKHIVAPVNRALGTEIRSLPYLHWWTFLSGYMEIGDCVFAQIVRIRDKKARGKALDKEESRWYKENRDIVDIKAKYTEAGDALINSWIM